MLPSRRGRKAVRGQSGNAAQSHAVAISAQQNGATLARWAGSPFTANEDKMEVVCNSFLSLAWVVQ